MTAILSTAPTAAPSHRVATAVRAGVTAVVANVVVWAVVGPGLGSDLTVQPTAAAEVTAIAAGPVVGATVVATLLAWASLALMERSGPSRTRWTVLALVVLVASLVMPLTAGTTTSSSLGLALLHVVTGAVLIPALRRTAR